MASLQSNPLGEDNMQEVMGVGGDYDREEYEVPGKRKKERSTFVYACRWELEDLEEAIRTQEADLIPRPPSALTLVGTDNRC